MKLKANWNDSDDFEMMFNGTYSSTFYRKLQRYVHKEFRKSQGIATLKSITNNPSELNFQKIKTIAKLGYYIPSAFVDRLNLKLTEDES